LSHNFFHCTVRSVQPLDRQQCSCVRTNGTFPHFCAQNQAMANVPEDATVEAAGDTAVAVAVAAPPAPAPAPAPAPPTQPPFAVVATPTNALSRLPPGGWPAVPDLATMLGALPPGCQEQVAMLLWGAANLKIWFTDPHGDDPDRSEYPQFWMSRLSAFHIQLGGKFKPGDAVVVTLHDAFSHEMIRNEDLVKDTCSIFTHRLSRKKGAQKKNDADAQPEGDADAMEAMPPVVGVVSARTADEVQEQLPVAELVAVDPEPPKQPEGAAVVVTETGVVHPGDPPRVRPKFESQHVALNDKGCATMRVYFGCTSRHVAKFNHMPRPFVMRAELNGVPQDEDRCIAWSQPFVIIARDDDYAGKKLKAARRLAHDLCQEPKGEPKKARLAQ
jgi:hypothetical protein